MGFLSGLAARLGLGPNERGGGRNAKSERGKPSISHLLGLFNMHFVNFWLARAYIYMNRLLEETIFIGYEKV